MANTDEKMVVEDVIRYGLTDNSMKVLRNGVTRYESHGQPWREMTAPIKKLDVNMNDFI